MSEKEKFLKGILSKIKNSNINRNEEKDVACKENLNNNIKSKKDFLNSIKVQEDSEIIYLKMKLENNEIRAIDLTDEQIAKLQKIYDKEILEKQNKIANNI